MILVVNGEPQEAEADTIAVALEALGYEGACVATALNGDFVPKRKRAETAVKEGDRLEILAPRQGG